MARNLIWTYFPGVIIEFFFPFPLYYSFLPLFSFPIFFFPPFFLFECTFFLEFSSLGWISFPPPWGGGGEVRIYTPAPWPSVWIKLLESTILILLNKTVMMFRFFIFEYVICILYYLPWAEFLSPPPWGGGKVRIYSPAPLEVLILL